MAVMNYSCRRLNSFACGANHPGAMDPKVFFLPHIITFLIPLRLTSLSSCTITFYSDILCICDSWQKTTFTGMYLCDIKEYEY